MHYCDSVFPYITLLHTHILWLLHFCILYRRLSVFCITTFPYFVLVHFRILHCYISVFYIATFPYFALLHYRICIATFPYLHCYISVFALLHFRICIATFLYLHCYISVFALLHFVFALLHFCICISAYHYWTICISIIQLQMINIYRPSFIPITFLLNDSGKSVFFQIRKKFVGSSEGNLQGIHQILRSNLIGS